MIRPIMPHKATGPDCVTVLHAVDQRWTTVDDRLVRVLPRLTKLICEDGEEPYDRAQLFDPSAFQLDGVQDLMELLAYLEPQPSACVIRGALKAEAADRAAVYRRYADHHGDTAMFQPADRRWLMVELDSIPCPPGVDRTDPILAGGAARRVLPPEFRSARCVVQLSSGAGIKAGIRAHMWFWLSRPISDAEAKRWLKAAPVDCSIYQPVGIHYVAKPCFDGVEDPCFERLGLLPGYAEVEVPALPDPERPRAAFMPAAFAAYTPPPRGLSFKATRSERYMLKCLKSVAEAPAGQRHPTIVRVAACLYGLAKGGALDPRDVEARILGAVQLSTFDRGVEEVYSALRWAWEHAKPWRLP